MQGVLPECRGIGTPSGLETPRPVPRFIAPTQRKPMSGDLGERIEVRQREGAERGAAGR